MLTLSSVRDCVAIAECRHTARIVDVNGRDKQPDTASVLLWAFFFFLLT